jgi:hypothetical protein
VQQPAAEEKSEARHTTMMNVEMRANGCGCKLPEKCDRRENVSGAMVFLSI